MRGLWMTTSFAIWSMEISNHLYRWCRFGSAAALYDYACTWTVRGTQKTVVQAAFLSL